MCRLAAVAALLLPLAAFGEDRASTKDAEGLVQKAVQYLKAEGKEKALAAFSDPKGPFAFRDLYVMAYDLEGRCLAHGAKRERVGKNLIDERDADGKQFVKERVAMAKASGRGWQDYKFANPATKKVEQKVAYFERVDDVIIVSGAYKP